MRGKPHAQLPVEDRLRIIPARAGANCFQASGGTGEHGSSPRVRGKPLGRGGAGIIRRIIPARAGQTRFDGASGFDGSDHPRACGANYFWVRHHMSPGGSSPRVRGKHGVREGLERAGRIIPARAGQTSAWRACRPGPSDHPRACGANWAVAADEVRLAGSSPRVRGKHGRQPGGRGPVRIIPARAGQTRCTSPLVMDWTDHPRACGANFTSLRRSSICFGSSPRVRGKHGRQPRGGGAVRIIPARAGQTRWQPLYRMR